MDFFGLDIGSVNTKASRLRKLGGGKYRLDAIAVVQTPVGGVFSESETNLLAMAELLKKISTENHLGTKNVALSVPESEVFTRVITMPKMSKSELESAIGWEAEQNIPLPVSEVNYSYTVVDVKADGSMEVMIVAAPKRLVEKYERILSMAGLTPVSLETELLAASRSLLSPSPLPVLLLMIGARTSDIGVVKNGCMLFTRSVGSAGEALTRALMTNLQLEVSQAESYKRTYGLLTNQLEGKVAIALHPVAEILIKEAKRTINFYETKFSDEKVKTIVLTGGSAGLPGLVPFMAQSLNMEVQIGNSLLYVDAKHKDLNIAPELLPMYSVCIGLGMNDL